MTITTDAPSVSGGFVELDGVSLYRIAGVDTMAPFLISLVSAADLWMFVTSSGGLTAGRVSPETALFPYETVDRLYDNSPYTGPLTVLQVTRAGLAQRWEPFGERPGERYRVERNLYKDALDSTLVFEEINRDLGLAFRATWQSSPRFGFVRSCRLEELSGAACAVRVLDGMQNILPHGATTALQSGYSNLLDAYKRAELDPSGLAIFALSSTLTDLAEASESLRATAVWQLGLEGARTLLSSAQVDAFRRGAAVEAERDVRGARGAYLLQADLDLAPGEARSWRIVADVARDAADIAELALALSQDRAGLAVALEADIAAGHAELEGLVASADGMQAGGDPLMASHHLANTLFNMMRGGIFAEGYAIDTADLRAFVAARSRAVIAQHAAFFADLPPQIAADALGERAAATGSPDLERLCTEYLPLTFSRRHGDPSRPWNRFAINVRRPDGSRRLDHQGNWRDIFQNWEPLAFSYPHYLGGMIATFLSATSADGYNPYRVTRAGIEWEVPEPENPWANIGYWSDHQIIYLLKLLEAAERFEPGGLPAQLGRRAFAYANVPYRIKPYPALVADPQHTIDFDWEAEELVAARVAERGTDGKLLWDAEGQVVHASMAEKLLLLLLAKLANFVPEGGIWMNTQRPEWNDANNALVGKGLSVVTLAYLRRYIVFCRELFAAGPPDLEVARELRALFDGVAGVLEAHRSSLVGGFSDEERRGVLDALGAAGSAYRWGVYRHGLSGELRSLGRDRVVAALDLALAYVEQGLRANRRADGLYHSYNTLRLADGRAVIGRLAEMLEGQVAILSSGMVGPQEALALLRGLRAGPLYRADQHSYMLYPNRDLPGFRQKNRIAPEQVGGLALVAALERAGDRRLITRDVEGFYHFSGDFRNAQGARAALEELGREPAFSALAEEEGEAILDLFEQTFHHAQFTGRSGSFFAYEGLGSIYWHMVAKLLLAVQEVFLRAAESGAADADLAGLAAAYQDIRAGLSAHKSPAEYGAFPSDPYSHTPLGRGAQQPGMTGQVKEEILTRMGELGLGVRDGDISFRPRLLADIEWLAAPGVFRHLDLGGRWREIELPAGSLAFTYCQVPVVYRRSSQRRIVLTLAGGDTRELPGDSLGVEVSRGLFARDGQVERITVWTDVA
ncbi:hypothetical protein K2Z83_25450 [Oscillochloris sp. ZM17-4]|uniref:hypothetical protein n=1 Tax=Oscillochloris sp. ZM17-4 TaxID=2866714 RepID=UPI001C7346B0|nr:hypothetical protein [Oscillochloris sp. ZM17-4]MBX0331005.1 hypothetical protein [Oscillochloris sp. ZM17-4]